MQASIPSKDALLVQDFVTTADGNAGGTTLVCSTLTAWADFDALIVQIKSGDYNGQARAIDGDTTSGTVTVASAFGGQIVSGVAFTIIGIPSGGSIDTATILTRIGTNTDAAGTTTLFARLRQIVDSYLADFTIGLAAQRTILQFIAFVDGMVYADSVSGTGSTAWPYGSPTEPTNTVGNAITIAAARKLKKIHLVGTISTAANISGYNFFGESGQYTTSYLSLLPGVTNTGCTFHRVIVTGTANGLSNYEEDCILYNLAGVDGFIRKCDIAGTLTLANPTLANYTDFNTVSTELGPITINCANVGNGKEIRFHRFTGTVTFTNLTSTARIRIYSSSGANITLAASCTGGTFEVHGIVGNFTDNSVGTNVAHYDIFGRAKGLEKIHDFLTGADAGSGTLNDANTSDTLTPTNLPCNIHLELDISNLNNNGDDFTLQVSVGTAGNERVVAYYELTSDGSDITCDTGSGTGQIIKQRRIDIDGILVAASEQVIIQYTKNGATDRNVDYKYVCGGGI